jgi:hypothetical protein
MVMPPVVLDGLNGHSYQELNSELEGVVISVNHCADSVPYGDNGTQDTEQKAAYN